MGNISDIFRGRNGFWVFLGIVGFGILFCIVAFVLLITMALLWGL